MCFPLMLHVPDTYRMCNRWMVLIHRHSHTHSLTLVRDDIAAFTLHSPSASTIRMPIRQSNTFGVDGVFVALYRHQLHTQPHRNGRKEIFVKTLMWENDFAGEWNGFVAHAAITRFHIAIAFDGTFIEYVRTMLGRVDNGLGVWECVESVVCSL